MGFPHVRLVGLPVSKRGFSTRPGCVPLHVKNMCLHVPNHGVPMYLECGPRHPGTPPGISRARSLHGLFVDCFRVSLNLSHG
jgi:hypothetical protein